MKYLELKNILIFIYAIMTLLVLIDAKYLIEIFQYLVNLSEELSEFEKERIKPQRLALQVITSLLKVIIFFVLMISLIKNNLKNKLLINSSLIAVIIFLYFDLPIHRCYNGSLESFWAVGRHFH